MKFRIFIAALAITTVLATACASQQGQALSDDINNAATGVSNMFTPENAQNASNEVNNAASGASNAIDSTAKGKPASSQPSQSQGKPK